MPPPTLSRFHWLLISAVLIGTLALVMGSWPMLLAVLGVLLVVIGLGVTLPQLQLFGPFVCRGVSNQRRVALTFDDGPDARSTPALLDLLKESGVTVAFFCVGARVAANSDLAARMVREGHLLGNHSNAHSNFTNFFGAARLKAELEVAQLAIRKATGITPTLFRPPMGLSNPRVFAVARALGLQVIGWSARGLDTITKNPDHVVARTLRGLKPGAILLLHDGNIPAEQLVLTVKLLLARLHEQNYEVVRLDKLLE